MKLPFRFSLMLTALLFSSCAPVDVPGARTLNVPAPKQADARPDAVNDRPESVLYLPLGNDVLIPTVPPSDPLPDDIVGPFELRGETLAGALQLIFSDYEIPIAFETEEALTRQVTVVNLRGPIGRMVRRVCGLADLYCSYEDGTLVVKESQTFTVSIPPVTGESDLLTTVATGIEAITGITPIVDAGTRTVIYQSTQRNSDLVERYFQRMRNSTAMVVFEVYIWEVVLSNDNASGINWEEVVKFGSGDLLTGFSVTGSVNPDLSPISIGLPTKGSVEFGADEVFQFISSFGAVKTISQPQITMMSGSESTLRAADTINYVSSLERTIEGDEVAVSTQTDTVDTGFTLTIGSNWDNATIYSSINIELESFQEFDSFDTGVAGSQIRLPITTERALETQVRIRPGDSLIIGGLVRETDQYQNDGPGIVSPILSTSRSANTENVELVFMMRPRVVVYTTDPQEGVIMQAAADSPDVRTEIIETIIEEDIDGDGKRESRKLDNSIVLDVIDRALSESVESETDAAVNEGMKSDDEPKENSQRIGTLPIDLLNPEPEESSQNMDDESPSDALKPSTENDQRSVAGEISTPVGYND